jgi:hypothetical protein
MHLTTVKTAVESFEERFEVWQDMDEESIGKVCTVSTVLPQCGFLTAMPLSSRILTSYSYMTFSVKR